jgi:tRNA threonylcarbamoyladenosine biosynthesis protein TsaB
VNLLAFDTSTDLMSVAVARVAGGRVEVFRQDGPGGAQASAALIPQILDLLGQAGLQLGELAAIVFGRGPGSFTGLRTACSVAQGLAWGAGLPVLPVDTLQAVADEAREHRGVDRVVAVQDARMDEVYSAAYAFEGGLWQRQSEFRLSRPEDVQLPAGWLAAGNACSRYGGRLPPGDHFGVQPTASALLRMAPALIAAGQAVPAGQAIPLYIRDKVALTTEERAARRAANP